MNINWVSSTVRRSAHHATANEDIAKYPGCAREVVTLCGKTIPKASRRARGSDTCEKCRAKKIAADVARAGQ
jgi:hypothetical protein